LIFKRFRVEFSLSFQIVIDSDQQDDIQFVNINEQNLVASVSRKVNSKIVIFIKSFLVSKIVWQ